ncbi:MAG: DUF4331 family protein [Hymenobacteraceae bacterium]|nr:DUF4331 family protein [Hymenobacteraceae bacterium]
MTITSLRNFLLLPAAAVAAVGLSVWSQTTYTPLEASSHREAPLIADDPLADNTDVYAFRSPQDPSRVVLIANYIPFELPQGGPNYYTFGENVRYEIHVKNDGSQNGDDVTYRFTFTQTNEDPTTFFNIRLNKQNLKTTYDCQKSINGGPFTTIVNDGLVPPNNIGPRSIEGAVGLNAPNYESLRTSAIANATGGNSAGEIVYCGPAEDPFFADLGAIFDLAGLRPNAPEDGLAKKNCHTIALSIPIEAVSKNGQPVSAAANILDPNYIIGVWASASRQQIRTLPAAGGELYSGPYVQVSRLGMPLTNEVINPVGAKDAWNARTPYDEAMITDTYLGNPELDLYVDERQFGNAVPALDALELQTKSLAGFLPGALAAGFDFGYGKDGLFPLKGSALVAGTALDNAAFGNYLLIDNEPRSVDIKPIFHTGVPNLIPYQLATGKTKLDPSPGKPAVNPLTAGKPFINNFLPFTFPGATNPGGDMLRLNMAVPVTPRNSVAFSNDGLLAAAVAGLTLPAFNNTTIQNIPNMDGFPNGRRLEDAVDKIELKAIGGVVLAAIGLWYDDFTPSSTSVLTPQPGGVLAFTSGLEVNDTTIRTAFPFVQTPWRGTGPASGPKDALDMRDLTVTSGMNVTEGTYRNVLVTATGNATLTVPLNITGRLTVATGGTLNTNCQPITGTGQVVVGPLATLRICDPAGLSAPGTTSSGALRNTGARSLSTDATYSYEGPSSQVTGVGLPATVGSLVIDNGSGVTLSQPVAVRQVLRLLDGNFSLDSRMLTLLSNALGTAMVTNQGGTVLGTATVQRYISKVSNAGLGYRHLSSPTTSSAVSDLATNGFTPIVNPAYNAIPMPTTFTRATFPNVLGYDERRDPTNPEFIAGYFSPNSLEDPLRVGHGYSVYIKGGLKPDFVGSLTQTDVTRSGLTRTGNFSGPMEKSGWHLLGNPFPSPLDWDLVDDNLPAGFNSEIFVFKSTGSGQQGIYLSRQNGMGTLPDGPIALGAGFFGRVMSGAPLSITLPSSARPVNYPYTQPVQYRTAPDVRPTMSVTLRQTGVADAVADEAIVYFQTGATAQVDSRFDAERPEHNKGGVPTLASLTTTGNELAVNGLPTTAFRAGTVIPLMLDVAAAGTYEMALGKWANMATTQVEVALLDRQSNTRTVLTPGATYAFRTAGGGIDVKRFALVFGPAASPAGENLRTIANALVLWPNPASGNVQLAGGTAGADVTVFDVTGRAVLRTKADTVGAATLDLTTLTKGVYTVRVGSASRRLVVE